MPLSAKAQALKEAWDFQLSAPSGVHESRSSEREFYDDPLWIGELADSLSFQELLRYRFARSGHINVQEARAYKTWRSSLPGRSSRLLGPKSQRRAV